MLILGVHPGYHDASAAIFDDYRLVACVQLERLTRRKIDGGRVPTEAIAACLKIAGAAAGDIDVVMLSRGAFPWRYYTHFRGSRLLEGHARRWLGREKHKSMERELIRAGMTDPLTIFACQSFREDLGLSRKTRIGFYNHHYAHALPTLFHSGWDDALLYTADGGGDNIQYSNHIYKNGDLKTLYGTDRDLLEPLRIDSLGLAYGYATQALGYRINRHEGKLTGLAAYGEPEIYDELAKHFEVDDHGRVSSDFTSYPAMRRRIFALAESVKPENVAASIQKLLEDRIIESVGKLIRRHHARNLGLSGGVFGNVRLNQRLAEETGVDEVFIYPAMSDAGLAAGGVLAYLLERDGPEAWQRNRYPLETLYLGENFDDRIDRVLRQEPTVVAAGTDPVKEAVARLRRGQAVAIFTGGMEYGPRALGARSILASPADPGINDRLNERLGRTEFMPFAPVVAEGDADEVFDLPAAMRYAARFMTVTCLVKPAWRERIPAVVHVDGTARPQLVRRSWNPLYFDILEAFKAATGLPVLINTSFNAHEEPIINSPEECRDALCADRIDAVVTGNGVYARRQEKT